MYSNGTIARMPPSKRSPLTRWLPVLTLLFATACDFAASPGPSVEPNAFLTSTALSFDAKLTEIALGAGPTLTPLGPGVTGTPIPATTSTPTPLPPATTGSDQAVCDRGGFVRDVTIEDGARFAPGESFVKTWRLENAGTCTWNSSYEVVFDEGDAMGSPAAFALTEGSVAPGEMVEISVTLTAPQAPGTYRGDWKLRNPDGQIFGLGTQGDASFWTIIQVTGELNLVLAFDNIHDCNDNPFAIFSLSNNGAEELQSAEITVTDLDTDETISGPYQHNGPFMGGANECPPGGDLAKIGRTVYLGASLGSQKPVGQKLLAAFTICTADNQNGICSEEQVEFTP